MLIIKSILSNLVAALNLEVGPPIGNISASAILNVTDPALSAVRHLFVFPHDTSFLIVLMRSVRTSVHPREQPSRSALLSGAALFEADSSIEL